MTAISKVDGQYLLSCTGNGAFTIGRSLDSAAFTDGMSNTVMFAERTRGSGGNTATDFPKPEDVITDLSKIGGLLVIARNSSFAYKGKSVDIRVVARELGVRSVLELALSAMLIRVPPFLRIAGRLCCASFPGSL